MSIKKHYLKSKPVCKVTLSLKNEELDTADKVAVLGEFNDWDSKKGIPMKKLKNGTFKTTIDLQVGHEYQFRYLIDDQTWVNDSNADKYVPAGLGYDDNSVVVV
ncbi:MAG: isoamylase early set domain-containing protein [Cyclobacteriaceae bacterium]|nr:isoamylase early set domain-containing protein [Cyclobacteriaceae bacterium]